MLKKMENSPENLRKNYKAWCSHHGLSKSTLANRGKIPNGLLQRVEDVGTAITLRALDKLAEAMDLQPWQLLFPAFDPSNPPTLVILEAERQLYDALKAAQRAVSAVTQYPPPTPTRALRVAEPPPPPYTTKPIKHDPD
jgi:transcriptional regulator with XRE-family HTH domain